MEVVQRFEKSEVHSIGDNLIQEYKKGKCTSWKRTFFLRSVDSGKIAVVSLNLFERGSWSLQKFFCCSTYYKFKTVFETKNVKVITPSDLKGSAKKVVDQVPLLTDLKGSLAEKQKRDGAGESTKSTSTRGQQSKTSPVPVARKRPLKNVWKQRRDENFAFMEKGGYTAPDGTVHTLKNHQEVYKKTKVYERSSCSLRRELKAEQSYETTILVDELNCLEAAEQEVSKGYKTAVVAFVSTREAGGAFTEGLQGSQEEEICYRSTLGSFMQEDLSRFFLEQSFHFPLAKNSDRGDVSQHEPDKVLITPEIEVFRDGEYQLLNNPFEIGVISCPAKPYPKVKGEQYVHSEDRELMRSLIRMQLLAAYDKGYTSVVLGAFGCGAFKNPPQEVAKLYHEVITGEFPGVFQSIRFPIYAGNQHLNENYTQFKRQFLEEEVSGEVG